MAKNSKIEWTDDTVNLWWGCSKVHTGCKNCYAETLSNRYGNDIWGEKKPRKLIKSSFTDLNKYQKLAAKEGVKRKIFCGSMMDIFEDDKPMVNHKGEPLEYTTNNQREVLFSAIAGGQYENLIFLFLTKRPENVKKILIDAGRMDWAYGLPSNVWLGTSISNQETADKYIPLLVAVRGKVFLSVEPQTGRIDLLKNLKLSNGCLPVNPVIDWVIQGGESGHNKRPFNLNWAYSMQSQCKRAGVPYFFKQIDKVKEVPDDLLREFPEW